MAIKTPEFAPSSAPVRGILRLAHVRRARPTTRAGRTVQLWRLGLIPLIEEEVGRLFIRVVLRLLMDEAHAVIERKAVAHLPVVLDEPLDVLVLVRALNELRLLLVLRERADRRVRVAKARVERVVGVIARN